MTRIVFTSVIGKAGLVGPILVIKDMVTQVKMPENLRAEDRIEELGNGRNQRNSMVVREG